MEPTAAAIEKIVRAIVHEVRPIRVILFGSIARGESHASSDVDLLVVVPEGSHRRQMARRLYQAVSGEGIPFDLVIATEGDINRYGDRIGLVYRTALKEGRLLYAA
jgi:predicted nucleotidyltransferase